MSIGQVGALLRQASQHPLLSVLVGFVLTGLVGNWIARHVTESQVQRDRELAAVEARRQSVEQITAFVYGRRTRAELLASALRRGAEIEEVKARKQLYDAIYLDWNTHLQVNLFRIRDLVRAQRYTAFEAHLQQQLVPLFREIDRCVTAAYDARLRGEDPKPTLEACRITPLFQATLGCSYAITDDLHKLANAPAALRTGAAPEPPRDAAEIAATCKAPG